MDLDGSMNGYIVDNEAVIVSCFAEEHLPPRVSHSTIRIITELWFFFFFFFPNANYEICVIISMEISLLFYSSKMSKIFK